jgi:hypothetical protein
MPEPATILRMSRTSGPSELPVELDRSAPEPVRHQLASRLRDAIRLGSLRAGVRLPASPVLAAELITRARFEPLEYRRWAPVEVDDAHGNRAWSNAWRLPEKPAAE